MFWTILIVLMAAVGFYAWWQMRAQNTFVVLPGQKERLVVQNLEGEMKVLEEGTHSLSAEWRKFIELGVNRETMKLEGEEVTTSNGVVLSTKLGFDIILGREFDPDHGGLIEPNKADDKRLVKAELLKQLVTFTDIANKEHQAIALRAVKSALEGSVSQYTSMQLLAPERLKRKPLIPRTDGLGPDEQWIKTHSSQTIWMSTPECKNKKDVLGRLAKLIELRANFDLRHLAINVISVRILDIDAKSADTQSALESAARAKNLKAVPDVRGLSKAQVLAANTPGFGQTNLGEGIAALGKEIGKAVVEAVKEYKKP